MLRNDKYAGLPRKKYLNHLDLHPAHSAESAAGADAVDRQQTRPGAGVRPVVGDPRLLRVQPVGPLPPIQYRLLVGLRLVTHLRPDRVRAEQQLVPCACPTCYICNQSKIARIIDNI